MGIEYQDMQAVLRVLKHEMPTPSGKLLILGDAVIHFTPMALQDLANRIGFKLFVELPDVLTPHALGVALGFSSVDTLDVNGKASINLDLQGPLPESLIGKYDMVVDAGVLFWCFEPGAVLKNIFRLAASGALIFHITALTGYFGRGYYNIHPRLLEDFYLSNNCDFIESSFRTKPWLKWHRQAFRYLIEKLGLIERGGAGVTFVRNPGSIYLEYASRYLIGFKRTKSIPELDIIPNNVVFTFSCRKTKAIEPSVPMQIC
jgi:hypothetical protein